MRLSRLVPALAAGTLLVASTSPVHAQEAPTVRGVGTTTGELTLLGLDAGELLRLDLLSDAGQANNDAAAGAVSAAARIAALAFDTAATEAFELPVRAVESAGAERTVGEEVAIPTNPLVSGSTLPLSLSAVVGEDGARSALSGAISDLDVLGGILALTGADLDLGSTALTGDAAASRGLRVQDLSVLDLESLLAGLGIGLTDLPLDTVLDLLDGLGLLEQLPLDQLGIDLDDLSVDGLLGVVDGLLGQVGDLGDGLDALEGLRAGLSGASPVCAVTDAVEDLLGGLLGTGGGGSVICSATQTVAQQLATVGTQIQTLEDRLDDVLDQLQGLLTGGGGALDLLGGTSLLTLDGLDVNVVTKATDAVATSVADVTARLGALQVGGLPALDLGAGSAQLEAALGQVEAAIGGVLGRIAPSLADLVRVDSLAEQTSVTQEGGKVVSAAEFTGLVVEVQPVLAEIEALLGGLGGVESIADTLTGLGLGTGSLPSLGAPEVLALNRSLAGATEGLPLLGGLAALDEVLTMRVASLSQQSVFAAAATPAAPGAPGTPGAPGQTPGLPRTGSSDTLLLGLAVAAAAVALGGRQLLRRSAG